MAPWWSPCSRSSHSNAAEHWCAFAMRYRGLHLLTVLKAVRSPFLACCAGSAYASALGWARRRCAPDVRGGSEESVAHRLPAKPSRGRRDARETNTDLRGSARETLARRGRLDPGDLHDDRRLLELMERRRRVQHPFKRLDQLRYDNPVVSDLDDLRLGCEPRYSEARHSSARARGRDHPWCEPAWGGASARGVLWLFGCLRPCCILSLDGSRGGPAPLANRLDAAFEPCGTHQRSHDRSGATAARRPACLLHSQVELRDWAIQHRRLTTTPGGRRRAEIALGGEKFYHFRLS